MPAPEVLLYQHGLIGGYQSNWNQSTSVYKAILNVLSAHDEEDTLLLTL